MMYKTIITLAWRVQVILLLSRVICPLTFEKYFNPFAPGDFAEKRVLKLVEWFSGHSRAIRS